MKSYTNAWDWIGLMSKCCTVEVGKTIPIKSVMNVAQIRGVESVGNVVGISSNVIDGNTNGNNGDGSSNDKQNDDNGVRNP